MTLKLRRRLSGGISIIPNVEYIRRVDEKRNVRTMHFYEIKQFNASHPIKHGISEIDILEITQ